MEPTSKRFDEPTPAGGVYSIATFLSKDGEPTTEEKADQVVIVEYDDKDEELTRTYGSFDDAN